MNINLDMAFEMEPTLGAYVKIRSRNKNSTRFSLALQAVFYY